MANRRLTCRLYPTAAQEKKLFDARKLHQLLDNACWDHRRYEWRKNKKSVDYFTQKNALLGFKEDWLEYKYLNHSSLQGTVNPLDLAYNSRLKGLRKCLKLKSIKNNYSWTYPDGRQKFKTIVKSSAKYAVDCGWVTLNDLNIKIKMRGRFKYWGKPTTCTIVYRPNRNQWYETFTIKTDEPAPLYGSESDLKYDSMIAYDLGTETALTCYDGKDFLEINNPRFEKEFAPKIKALSKELRRKQKPIKRRQKASKRWKKANKKISKIKAKKANARKDWQHKVTTEMASRYDIVVTEKLNTKGMTSKAKKGKRKKQKAGLNKSIQDVGFATLNQMALDKITGKGGLHITIDTRKVKPSQRCPECGAVHKHWAQFSNRYHICDKCGFEISRDRGSVMVMWNSAANKQAGVGSSLVSRRCSGTTAKNSKNTGSMRQLGQMKRQKSGSTGGSPETPPSTK